MTMPSRITAGVDTHLDIHVAAALDERGGLLGVETFATTPAGYAGLLGWLTGFGDVDLVGVEGTGTYGAGLTRSLHAHQITVVEVDRPTGSVAGGAASPTPKTPSPRPAPPSPGDACGLAKTRDGNVEAMRVLRVARSAGRKARPRP